MTNEETIAAPSAPVDQLESSSAKRELIEQAKAEFCEWIRMSFGGIVNEGQAGVFADHAAEIFLRRLVPVDSSEASRSAGQGDEGEAKWQR